MVDESEQPQQGVKRPLPPEGESLFAHTQSEWKYIRDWWLKGYSAESRPVALEGWIEQRRQEIFQGGLVDGRFDWSSDWLNAKSFHDYQIDQVNHLRTHLAGVKEHWSKWSESSTQHFSSVSLEALRSVLLLNGAAIIADLAVLTGQIDDPRSGAVFAAKITTLTSVVSMIMMATGHALLWDRMSYVLGRVRSAIIGTPRHRRVYAVGRYLGRHLDPVTRVANALIYGSIIVFAGSALVCALILAFS